MYEGRIPHIFQTAAYRGNRRMRAETCRMPSVRKQEITMTVRFHGGKPYRAAAVHGGPGAAGSAAGLAEELAGVCGTIEPLQTKDSVNGQVEELGEQLRSSGNGKPFVLIGHSWGAWLCAMTAARYPELAARLILVGAGPLEERYVPIIEKRRLSHFSGEERNLYFSLLEKLQDPRSAEKSRLLQSLGELCGKADSFCELPDTEPPVIPDGEIYSRVFPEAAEMRKNGALCAVFRKLRCPLLILHGEYDTHPPEGLTEPLAKEGIPCRFQLLRKCGHTPWRERFARTRFLTILRREIHAAGCC